MKNIILFCFWLCWLVDLSSADSPVCVGQGSLSWSAPTTNANGDPITDLAGYMVYHGKKPGVYDTTINIGNTTSYVVQGLECGRIYYFVVDAYDLNGNPSQHSNEVSKEISPQIIDFYGFEGSVNSISGKNLAVATDISYSNGAAQFNGASSKIEIPININGATNFELHAGFVTSTRDSLNPILTFGGGYGFGGCTIGVQQGRAYSECFSAGGSPRPYNGFRVNGSRNDLGSGAHSFKFSVITNVLRVYVDEVLEIQTQIPVVLEYTPESKLLIGRDQWGSNYFSGSIDSLSVYFSYNEKIGDYNLSVDTQDSSGYQNHAISTNITFSSGKAIFDGGASKIEVPVNVGVIQNLIVDTNVATVNTLRLNTVLTAGGGYGFGGLTLGVQGLKTYSDNRYFDPYLGNRVNGDGWLIASQEHNLKLVVSNGLTRLFKDNLIDFEAPRNPLVYSSDSKFLLGCNQWGNECFTGTMGRTQISLVNRKFVHYTFEDGTLKDVSGFGNNGIATNVAIINSTATFDGVSSKIDVPLTISNNQLLIFDTEFQTIDTPKLNPLFTFGGGYGYGGCLVGIQYRRPHLTCYSENYPQGRRFEGATIDSGWHTLKFTFIGGRGYLLVDDILHLKTGDIGLLSYEPHAKIIIGRNGWGNEYFQGSIQNPRIFLP